MKFSSFLLFFLVALTGSISAQHPLHITFRLSSPDLSEDSTVFITGSLEQLGYWDAAKVKMQFEGNHIWTKEITIDNSLSIEYKYTLGSWEHEGASINGSALPNFKINVTKDTLIKDNISSWTKGLKKKEIHGQITGTVKYHLGMKGEGLKDRDLIVWVPPGYDANPEKRYSVLYMQDGENIFDPATSSFGADWRIDESIDSMIHIHVIEPIIVVGIYNTMDRSKEYSPGEKGTEYVSFMVNKVKPFIDSVYRTEPDPENTMVGGSSSGGTISFMIAWEHPDVFGKAICMSPAFKIDDIDYVKTVNSYHGKRKKVFFYIDLGGVGLESQLQPGVNEMMEALNNQGFKAGKDYAYVSAPEQQHSEAYWSKRFPYAIGWCLSRK